MQGGQKGAGAPRRERQEAGRWTHSLLPVLGGTGKGAANLLHCLFQVAIARDALRLCFPDLLLKLVFCHTTVLWARMARVARHDAFEQGIVEKGQCIAPRAIYRAADKLEVQVSIAPAEVFPTARHARVQRTLLRSLLRCVEMREATDLAATTPETVARRFRDEGAREDAREPSLSSSWESAEEVPLANICSQ